MSATPNPGSSEALEQGCTCPVMDNARGKGGYIDVDGTPLFWTREDCPLHGYQPDNATRVTLDIASDPLWQQRGERDERNVPGQEVE